MKHQKVEIDDDIMGDSKLGGVEVQKVGDIVHFFLPPDPNAHAAIITRVRSETHVDLAVFRSDGLDRRVYEIPKIGPRTSEIGHWAQKQ